MDSSRRFAVLAALIAAALAILPLGSAAAAGCPNEALRVGQGSSLLPSCRAYERVTPEDKNFGDLTQGIVSADGDHVQVTAYPVAFSGSTSGTASSYAITRRGDGWHTTAANAPGVPSYYASALVEASDDLVDQVLYAYPLSVLPGESDSAVLFRRTAAGVGEIVRAPFSGDLQFAGSSADASHVLFQTSEILVPELATQTAGTALYDDEGGTLRAVGVQSDGVTPTSTCGAVLGAGGPTSPGGGGLNAISPDGGTVFFTSPDPYANGPECANPQLYVRRGGTTVEVSAPEPSAPVDPPAPVTYQGATVDGSAVYFSTTRALTAGDPTLHDPELYRYDVAGGSLERESVGATGSEDGNFVGAVAFASHGDVAYFVARGVLAPGGTEGELNLYRRGGGQTEFVATLGAGDGATYTADGQPGRIEARASSDGNRLVFRSSQNLTGYDAAGHDELYLFDAADQTITCVSCNVDGSPPTGSVTINGNTTQLQVPIPVRHIAAGMSADGERVFFQSDDAVVPAAVNGRQNVYEWDAGAVSLISDGDSRTDSLYIGSGADGRDVFFSTADALVPADGDTNVDIYDARIGGGVAEPSPIEACAGEACQGPSTQVPPPPSIGSIGFLGRGNGPGPAKASVRITRSKGVGGAAAKLKVRVSDAGKISVAGPSVRGTSAQASKAGTYTVTVALSSKARKSLKQQKRLKVKVRISFRANDRGTASKTISLTFRQPPEKRAEKTGRTR